jgi:hypothetical protein
MNSNLKEYKIPVMVERLYNDFRSTDRKARQAMLSMYRYQTKRSHL